MCEKALTTFKLIGMMNIEELIFIMRVTLNMLFFFFFIQVLKHTHTHHTYRKHKQQQIQISSKKQPKKIETMVARIYIISILTGWTPCRALNFSSFLSLFPPLKSRQRKQLIFILISWSMLSSVRYVSYEHHSTVDDNGRDVMAFD